MRVTRCAATSGGGARDTGAVRAGASTSETQSEIEAALWAFHHGSDFRDGALLAVNLGDDADTTGAVYGQLAGAFYGANGIPAGWRQRLALLDELERIADALRDAGPTSKD